MGASGWGAWEDEVVEEGVDEVVSALAAVSGVAAWGRVAVDEVAAVANGRVAAAISWFVAGGAPQCPGLQIQGRVARAGQRGR